MTKAKFDNSKYDPVMALRMPADLKESFQARCHEMDLTPSQVARKLLREWIAKQDRKSGLAKA